MLPLTGGLEYNYLAMFTATAPLWKPALAAAQVYLGTLPTLTDGFFKHIYYHWTVAPFDHEFTDYNAEIILVDYQWRMKTEGDIQANASADAANMASHTWHRNSHAFGIAVSGMDGATMTDFGPDAVQVHELEFLAACGAAVAKKYGLDASGRSDDGLPVIMTHAEAAIADGYYGERWDLAEFVATPIPPSQMKAAASGAVLRMRTHQYKLGLV